jgi:hypothetical protein
MKLGEEKLSGFESLKQISSARLEINLVNVGELALKAIPAVICDINVKLHKAYGSRLILAILGREEF